MPSLPRQPAHFRTQPGLALPYTASPSHNKLY